MPCGFIEQLKHPSCLTFSLIKYAGNNKHEKEERGKKNLRQRKMQV